MSKLAMPQRNLVVWFEIPVRSLDAALDFYGRTLGLQLRLERRAGATRAIFDAPGFTNSGALVEAPERAGGQGTLVYLHAGRDLQRTLERAESAGGRIRQAPLDLGGGLGRFAVIEDPDGNPLGLHSPPHSDTRSRP